MKVGILAGGFGTRLGEDTAVKPKPMVEIGGRPILWHIMMHYATYKFRDFVIALGYKGEVIKKYMVDYCQLTGHLTVDFGNRTVKSDCQDQLDWKVELVETGLTTLTGGRIKRLAPYFRDGTFMLTWGDAVSDVNLNELLAFHKSHGKLATLTAVRPPARYGHLRFDGNQIIEFSEKPQTAEGWINGAYFVLEPEIFDYIDGDNTQWEREPLERLAMDRQLVAYKHQSFWQCMDTPRDKYILETLWQKDHPPWRIWD